MIARRIVLAALAGTIATANLRAQGNPTHLLTRWGEDIRAWHVLPEYPRPQLIRSDWTNLNGNWDYAITARNAPQPRRWRGSILVPFAVQSQLSGVERAVSDSERLWYHRTFRVTKAPTGHRLLLHFGAVDWETTVYVNGVLVGTHRGGYDPFTFDITDAIRGVGSQTLVVSVWDPTDRGSQPRGKQVLHPESIWYTAVTGIWQTVWLEPVLESYIYEVVAVPDIDAGTVTLKVATEGTPPGTQFRATVVANGHQVAELNGTTGEPLVVKLRDAHLWSPSDPFLYDLRVTLAGGDVVRSYFGMRKIAIGHDSAGIARLFLNNRPLFQYGTLDQGWWPDGLYTAPTDEALRYDLAETHRLGFNMIRKHVKVEPERWYYHADRMGMLVWQDMPSGDNKTEESRNEFAEEMHHIVDALRNHPSIVMWVPFNEGWGQHDTEQRTAWLKNYDPTRLVNNASGWTDHKVGDVADIHVYPGPGVPPLEPNRAVVLGEFGGLGLPIPGHLWLNQNNWGYRTYPSQAALGAAYRDLIAQLRLMMVDGLAAAVYTQTTDVEVEVNGLMTYDRAVIKLPPEASAAAATLFDPPPRVRTIMASSQQLAQLWRYTIAPPPIEWSDATFGDSTWATGPGGFGTSKTPGSVVRTPWSSSDIWLRRTFTVDVATLLHPYWRIHHDEDAELYLNGQLVARLSGYTAGYVRIPFDQRAMSALRSGLNTIAIHVHQTTGGQYIDLGIDDVVEQ